MTNDEIYDSVVLENYGYDDEEAIALGLNDPDSIVDDQLRGRVFAASDIRSLVNAALDVLREELANG